MRGGAFRLRLHIHLFTNVLADKVLYANPATAPTDAPANSCFGKLDGAMDRWGIPWL